MENTSFTKKLLVMIALSCLCIVLGFIFPRGIYLTSDDAEYSRAAYHISTGDFRVPSSPFHARVGNTFSIAVFYYLFGVNDYSLMGASLMFLILNVLLIFLLSQELFDEKRAFRVGTLGALLFVCVPISIKTSTSLLPHQGQTFFMFLAIYFLLRGEKKVNPWWYCLSGISIGIAYLFHITSVFIFFVIMTYWLVSVVVKRQFDKKVSLIFLMFFVVFVCETALYYVKTDTLFYRQTLTLQKHFKINDANSLGDVKKIDSTKLIDRVIESPFSGFFLGDSWLLEPFRQLLLNPSHSIIYHLFFLANILLLIKKDKKILYLNVLFWPLFLYYSYGSQSPVSYITLRRLPRYILPCLLPACIITAYGIERLVQRKFLQHLVIGCFIAISIFSVSIKGGDIGQRIHQSRFFYEFIKRNPEQHFVTDSMTSLGLDFLSTYQPLKNVRVIHFEHFLPQVRSNEFIAKSKNSYVCLNISEMYGASSIKLDAPNYRLIAKHERKPRKICYVPGIREVLKESLCNLSNGGKIYQVQYDDR